MPGEKPPSLKDLFGKAEEAENNEDDKGATDLYIDILAVDNLNISAYNKLMKLYRRSKDYKKELSIINKAIKSYEAYYKGRRPKHSKKVDTISSQLNKSLGLVDKKGVSTVQPEPLGTWNKRKLVVEKKLGK